MYLILPSSARSATHTNAAGQFFRITELAANAHIEGPSPNIHANIDGYTPIIPPVPVVAVPPEIKNWQAVAVLEAAGALAAVTSALAAMTGPEGIVIRAAWIGGEPLKRDGQTVAAISAALSFSPAQVDAWFVQAAGLVVP